MQPGQASENRRQKALKELRAGYEFTTLNTQAALLVIEAGCGPEKFHKLLAHRGWATPLPARQGYSFAIPKGFGSATPSINDRRVVHWTRTGIVHGIAEVLRANGIHFRIPPELSDDDSRSEEIAAAEEAISKNLVADPRLLETEKQTLIAARLGQGLFRRNVQKFERACRLTGVRDTRVLVAGHIKPWRVSSNEERLDGENGFLLAPTADRLFDQGLITFADSGTVLPSGTIATDVLVALGIDMSRNVGSFTSKQRAYLAYHRSHVFIV